MPTFINLATAPPIGAIYFHQLGQFYFVYLECRYDIGTQARIKNDGDIIEHVEIETKSAAPLELTSRRRQAVTAGVLLGMCLAALEVTIVGTAMPTIIAALGGLNHYSWVVSAYLITSTVPVPVWGKLSDIYGRRRLYQFGIFFFLLGSVLSGMASTMTQLILFRAIQGLGAGVLMPLAMTIIGDIYSLEERTRMQGIFSGVWGLASIVGPLVGGYITDHLSWRWVFYINIPFGIAAALIVGFALREPKLHKRPDIDYAGALTLIVAVTLFMFALVEGGSHVEKLLSPVNLALLVSSLALFGLFLFIEKRAIDPIMPPQLFKNRVVSVALIASCCAGIGMFGAITFVPFFAQGVLGSTATQAGSLLTPLMLSWVVMGVVGGRLLLRIGFKNVAMIGLTLMTLGLAALSTSSRTSSRLSLSLELALVGAGLGLTVLTLLLAKQQSVPRTQLGLVTSLSQFSRSIGGAMGVAIMGAILSSSLGSHLMAASTANGPLTHNMAAKLAANPNALIDVDARATLPVAVVVLLQEALAKSLTNVFWLSTAFALFALVAVSFLPRKIGQPAPEACSVETGERMLVAELANIDAEHEPSSLKDERPLS